MVAIDDLCQLISADTNINFFLLLSELIYKPQKISMITIASKRTEIYLNSMPRVTNIISNPLLTDKSKLWQSNMEDTFIRIHPIFKGDIFV